MQKKNSRLNMLRYMLQSKRYDNQDKLLEDLKINGFEVAQATLSRDLRQMKVYRLLDEHGLRVYVLPKDEETNLPVRPIHKNAPHKGLGFLKADISGNILVIKTLHGYASSLAAEIDNNPTPLILGTLAGDDTILIVLSADANRKRILSHMIQLIPSFKLN